MKAKDYLSSVIIFDRRIRHKERDIDILKAKLEELLTAAAGVQAIRYDVDKVTSSGTNTIEDTMIKVADAMEQLELELQELSDIIQNYQQSRTEIIEQIEHLDDDNDRKTYSELLYRRYVNDMTLEEIAVEMNYSYPYIKHAHGWALSKFQKKYLNDTT